MTIGTQDLLVEILAAHYLETVTIDEFVGIEEGNNIAVGTNI